MIEFITLFLGAIVTGHVDVELMVGDKVAAVEIRLDNQSLTHLRGAPWQFEMDLGEELEPHLLEAIGVDREGVEIDRARQWINLAPQTAEIGIVLDRNPKDGTVTARVSWESITAKGEPTQVRAFFDDRLLDVVDLQAIPLPAYDPQSMHHLRVELEFPDSIQSSADVTFGGVYGDAIDTALTPFPVALLDAKRLPAVEAMQGWFWSGDKPLSVQAAEKGVADLYVVRDPAIQPLLERMLARGRLDTGTQLLNRDHRLRFVHARPFERQSRNNVFELFRLSAPVQVRSGSLLESLAAVYPADLSTREARVADAVAAAGLTAHQTGRRRAVVLITTGTGFDSSILSPNQARRYLARIGVPLFIWTPLKGEDEAGAWGAATNIFPAERLESAYRKLGRQLNRQRIVWFNGIHLPQTIGLDPTIEQIEIVR